jgi:hypothetical protein
MRGTLRKDFVTRISHFVTSLSLPISRRALLALIPIATLGAPSLASAQLSWSAPAIVDSGSGETLSAVACPLQTQCTAVDQVGQEVTFNPTASTSSGTPVLIDTGGQLTSIACPSSTQCTAVDLTGDEVTFNPTSPTTPTLENVDSQGGQGEVTGVAVSCPSSTQCTAVDDQAKGEEVTFDPTTGNQVSAAVVGVNMSSLSCPSTSQCVAVTEGGNEVAFDPVSPSGATAASIGSSLTSVACIPGGSECVAVSGGYGSEVKFNPSSPATHTSGSLNVSYLESVSCPSAGACTAVSGSETKESTFTPGSTPGETNGVIDTKVGNADAVACWSASQCTAVDGQGRAVTFNPGSPAGAKTLTVDPDGFLQSLACPSTTQCTAAARGGIAGEGLAADGDVVSFEPKAPGATAPVTLNSEDALFGLACGSVSRCAVVTSEGLPGFASSVTGFAPSSPAGHTTAYENGTYAIQIACPGGAECVSVGEESLVTPFDPGATLQTPTATKIDGFQTLETIACPSEIQCSALDTAGNELTFNPKSVGSPTAHAIDSHTYADSISCSSTTQCTSVDFSGYEVTFTPSSGAVIASGLIDVPAAHLNSVACLSASDCVAVDSYGRAIEGNPLEPEHWNTTRINGADSLRAVACPSSSECVAVDDAGREFSATTTIATAVPSSTSPPTIFGSPQVGGELSALAGSWSEAPESYAYQWQDCDSAGANCTPIAGAIKSTYTVTSTDLGHRIVLSETASNKIGSSEPAASTPTAVVGATGETKETEKEKPQESETPGATPTGGAPANPPGLIETVTTSSGQTITLTTAAGQEGYAALDQHLLGGLSANDIAKLLANGGFSIQIPLSYPAYPGNYSASGEASSSGIPGYNGEGAGGGEVPGSGGDAFATTAHAKAHHRSSKVLLFHFEHTYTTAGTYTAKIRFTPAGLKLLRAVEHAHRKLKVSIAISVTAMGRPPIQGHSSATLKPGPGKKKR